MFMVSPKCFGAYSNNISYCFEQGQTILDHIRFQRLCLGSNHWIEPTPKYHNYSLVLEMFICHLRCWTKSNQIIWTIQFDLNIHPSCMNPTFQLFSILCEAWKSILKPEIVNAFSSKAYCHHKGNLAYKKKSTNNSVQW